jgi:hypothetical protein
VLQAIPEDLRTTYLNAAHPEASPIAGRVKDTWGPQSLQEIQADVRRAGPDDSQMMVIDEEETQIMDNDEAAEDVETDEDDDVDKQLDLRQKRDITDGTSWRQGVYYAEIVRENAKAPDLVAHPADDADGNSDETVVRSHLYGRSALGVPCIKDLHGYVGMPSLWV